MLWHRSNRKVVFIELFFVVCLFESDISSVLEFLYNTDNVDHRYVSSWRMQRTFFKNLVAHRSWSVKKKYVEILHLHNCRKKKLRIVLNFRHNTYRLTCFFLHCKYKFDIFQNYIIYIFYTIFWEICRCSWYCSSGYYSFMGVTWHALLLVF